MASPPPLTKPISDLPLHFALVLFPNFQALDVFGPLDALNTIKRLYPSLPLQLSILSSTLSPTSTFPSSTDTISPSTTPFEQQVVPTHIFTSPPSEPIHILFIPGGFGTRLHAKSDWQPVVNYLDTFFSNDNLVRNLKGIFTVCTGSILLARSRIRDLSPPATGPTAPTADNKESKSSSLTGTLDGLNVTTNKRALQRAQDEHPNVLWEPQARWVTTTLSLPLTTTTTSKKIKLWTTSGVSAGIDGIFSLISDEFGPPIAEYISEVLEYTRTLDPKNDPFAPSSESSP